MCVQLQKKGHSPAKTTYSFLLPDAQTYYSVRLFRTTCLILIQAEPRQRESTPLMVPHFIRLSAVFDYAQTTLLYKALNAVISCSMR